MLGGAQPEIVSNGVQMQTANGKQSVTNADYISYIRREQPAAVIALADEVGPHCGRNRREKSVKRTILWLKELCEQKESLGCRVYGVCVGGTQLQMRQRCAEEMKNLPIDGEQGNCHCLAVAGGWLESRDAYVSL
jgi:tRNA-guanine family transglycosylase